MAIARKTLNSPEARSQVSQIVDAVRKFDLAQSEAWPDLDSLSSDTSIDAVHVDPEGVILNVDGTFEGSASVYVNLDYGPEEDLRTTEAFIGRFDGRLAKGKLPAIEHFRVDTSPFVDALNSLGETDGLKTG